MERILREKNERTDDLEIHISQRDGELGVKIGSKRSLQSLEEADRSRVKDKRIKDLEASMEETERIVKVKNERIEYLEAQNQKHLTTIQQLQNKLQENQEEKTELVEENGYLLDLNRTLTARERMFNEELQDARNELTWELAEVLQPKSPLAVKILGELDGKAFYEACRQKFSSDIADEIAAELISKWEEQLRDPHWHPFKIDTINGELQEVIVDDDEKLRELKSDLGEEACIAVKTALSELNEHNPSGRYPTSQLWNTKSNSKATLSEAIKYVLNQWKTLLHQTSVVKCCMLSRGRTDQSAETLDSDTEEQNSCVEALRARLREFREVRAMYLELLATLEALEKRVDRMERVLEQYCPSQFPPSRVDKEPPPS